jgi:hypothetical protein
MVTANIWIGEITEYQLMTLLRCYVMKWLNEIGERMPSRESGQDEALRRYASLAEYLN